MYCPNCGYNNKDVNRFCLKCGTPLKTGEAPHREAPRREVPRREAPRRPGQEKKPQKNTLLIVIAALGLIAVLCVGIIFSMFLKNSKPETPAPEVSVAESVVEETPEPEVEEKPEVKPEEEEAEEEEEESDEFFFPDSSKRRLTDSDLSNLSSWELRIARNEIFARHGRKFDNPEVAAYFAGHAWYEGTIDSKEFDENSDKYLNECEVYNVELIQKYEAKLKN